jgi:hypothetical protein
MRNERTLIALFVLAAAACAELPDQTSDARAERIYRTGSNVPVHEHTTSGKVLTLDRDASDDLVKRMQPLPPPSAVKGGN